MLSPLTGTAVSEQENIQMQIEEGVRRSLRAMQAAAPRMAAQRGGSTPSVSYGITYDRETGARVEYFKAGDVVGVNPVRS